MTDESLYNPAPEPAAAPMQAAPPPRTSPGVVVAIVLSSLALALSLLVAVVTAGIVAYQYFGFGPEDAWIQGGAVYDATPGTVKAADGTVVEGLGAVEHPARIGEHTLSWPTYEGGVLDATVTAVDWDAEAKLAEAFPANPEPLTGTVYVLVTMDLSYTGPGNFAPAADVFVGMETDSWISYYDELAVDSEHPLQAAGFLSDGETVEVTAVLEMRKGERDSALLSIETLDGEPLYLAEG